MLELIHCEYTLSNIYLDVQEFYKFCITYI